MVYQPGEKAYLRVTPMKGAHRFGIKGKLAPRYIGPFTILERRGKVAYQLELPFDPEAVNTLHWCNSKIGLFARLIDHVFMMTVIITLLA